MHHKEASRGFGSWEEGLFIFRELGNTSYHFRGAGEQGHTFGDLGSTAKKAEENNSGIWGGQSIIFRDQGSTDPLCGPH